ncbi:MAG: peptidylprolyl isomerase [Thermoleophilia bacterium]|nr:peptidylprolyl isomerase [Thermoleophilia bacterium]
MSDLHRRRLAALPLLTLLLVVALFVAACGGDDSSSSSASKSTTSKGDDTASTTETTDGSGSNAADASAAGGTGAVSDAEVAKRQDSYDKSPGAPLDPKKTYVVRVTTNLGAFDIKVDQKAGPIAAANFVGLVKEGYYDGIKFHRVIKGFMVQTGDPTGTGMGGPGYSIKDDDVTGSYTPGVVAMANAGPDTGGSQFFVVQGTDVQLGPDYAIFGKVDAAGLKTIDKIANVEVSGPENSTPVDTVRIVSAKLVEGA